MAIALISNHVGTNPTVTSEWPALISDMEGTNPLTMSQWLMDSSLPLGGNLDLENTKLLPKVLKLHSGHWILQHISYLFVYHNILELHCSSLYHIPDIMELDLGALLLVMEHWVLCQLHATLIAIEDASHV